LCKVEFFLGDVFGRDRVPLPELAFFFGIAASISPSFDSANNSINTKNDVDNNTEDDSISPVFGTDRSEDPGRPTMDRPHDSKNQGTRTTMCLNFNIGKLCRL
jgi:hypothetical protein